MRAAIYTSYGEANVIKIKNVLKPMPKSNEVLVKIKASSVTRADTMMRAGVPKFGRLFLGFFKPKNTSLGTGFSGVVDAIGDEVNDFKVGDEVFGEKLFSNGTNAEYICVSEDGILILKPEHVSHQEAAPICDGFLTSYSFLKDIAKLKRGQHILINGASGSLGTAAVQIAKLMGAKVTGVCSASNLDLVLALGADCVIDYTKRDFTKMEDFYDVIYDTVGKLSYKQCKPVMNYSSIFMSPVLNLEILLNTIISPKKVKFSATGMRKQQELKALLKELTAYFKQGQLKTIVDKVYSLENIVKAHQYLETGRKKGNLAIINS